MFSIRNFKFLGFALGKGKNGLYIRAHAKSLRKAKAKLRELTSCSQGRNVRKVMENVKVYIRVYIWKQWKVPQARIRNLMILGIPRYYAHKWGYVQGYWNVAGSPVLQRSITNKRLAQVGFYSLSDMYKSLHLCD